MMKTKKNQEPATRRKGKESREVIPESIKLRGTFSLSPSVLKEDQLPLFANIMEVRDLGKRSELCNDREPLLNSRSASILIDSI